MDICLSVVIPAFNEEKRLAQTLNKIKDYLSNRGFSHEIIVIDDGSTDNTQKISLNFFNEYPIGTVISLPHNAGKGAAVKAGVEKAQGRLILFSDADLSTPIEELDNFLPIFEKGYPIVIGSRGLRESVILKRQIIFREIMGKIFGKMIRTTILPGISDSQCGFKCFSGETARILFSQMKITGYAFDIEILLMARERGFLIKEVPVKWTNSPDSKLHILRDSFKMLCEVIRIKSLYGKISKVNREPTNLNLHR